jgi:uncharacterized membrane-anchored protein YitT (DUF2179 family)
MDISAENIDWKQIFSPTPIIYNLIGVALAAIALEAFMIPNKFLDGGVTGIAILINLQFGITLNLLLFVLNIPFLIMGYKKTGNTFAIQATI